MGRMGWGEGTMHSGQGRAGMGGEKHRGGGLYDTGRKLRRAGFTYEIKRLEHYSVVKKSLKIRTNTARLVFYSGGSSQ